MAKTGTRIYPVKSCNTGTAKLLFHRVNTDGTDFHRREFNTENTEGTENIKNEYPTMYNLEKVSISQ